MSPPLTFTEVTRVTSKYNKQGKLVETVVSREVAGTRSNRMRRLKAEALELVRDKIAKCEIAPWFGNAIAKIIKNPKVNPRQKVVKTNKQYVEFSGAELRFKRSIITDYNALMFLMEIYKHPCITEQEQKDDLAKLYAEKSWRFVVDYPKEILGNDSLIKSIRKNKLCNEWNKRRWYEFYTDERPCTLSEAELDAIINEKVKEAEGGSICMSSQKSL